MKKTFFICTILVCIFTNIRAQWKPVGNRIVTPWTEKVDVTSVLPEYPRPIMERNEWKKLEWTMGVCYNGCRKKLSEAV